MAVLPGWVPLSAPCSAAPARLRTGNPGSTLPPASTGSMSASSNTDEVWFCQPCLLLLCRAAPPPVVSVLCPSVHAQQHRQAHTRTHTHMHTRAHAHTCIHTCTVSSSPSKSCSTQTSLSYLWPLGDPPKTTEWHTTDQGQWHCGVTVSTSLRPRGQLRTSKAQSKADARGWAPAPGSRGAQTLQCTGMIQSLAEGADEA